MYPRSGFSSNARKWSWLPTISKSLPRRLGKDSIKDLEASKNCSWMHPDAKMILMNEMTMISFIVIGKWRKSKSWSLSATETEKASAWSTYRVIVIFSGLRKIQVYNSFLTSLLPKSDIIHYYINIRNIQSILISSCFTEVGSIYKVSQIRVITLYSAFSDWNNVEKLPAQIVTLKTRGHMIISLLVFWQNFANFMNKRG